MSDTPEPSAVRRPRTVTAAAVVTIVTSLLAAVALVGVAVLLAARGERLFDSAGDNPALEGFSREQLVGIMTGVSVAMVVWCLVAVGLAVLVLRRSSTARILLVVCAVGAAGFSLIAILSLISALTLVAAVAVVVLLFTGGANAWFAGTPAGPDSPGVRREPAAAPLDSVPR